MAMAVGKCTTMNLAWPCCFALVFCLIFFVRGETQEFSTSMPLTAKDVYQVGCSCSPLLSLPPFLTNTLHRPPLRMPKRTLFHGCSTEERAVPFRWKLSKHLILEVSVFYLISKLSQLNSSSSRSSLLLLLVLPQKEPWFTHVMWMLAMSCSMFLMTSWSTQATLIYLTLRNTCCSDSSLQNII